MHPTHPWLPFLQSLGKPLLASYRKQLLCDRLVTDKGWYKENEFSKCEGAIKKENEGGNKIPIILLKNEAKVAFPVTVPDLDGLVRMV